MTSVSGGAGSGGQTNQVPCITFILLHYFHLTNFFWMFVEGVHIKLKYTAKNLMFFYFLNKI